MKKTFLFFFIASVLMAAYCYAIDLNAPGEKKVTVGSEIKRGHDAITLEHYDFDFLHILDKIDRVFKLNKQKNTDSPGFMLGASFGAWSVLNMNMQVLKGRSKNYDLAEKSAYDYFKDFRKLQWELKINDEKLMEVIGFKKPLMNDIYKWDYKIKNK